MRLYKIFCALAQRSSRPCRPPRWVPRICVAATLLGQKEKPVNALIATLKTGNRMVRVQALSVLDQLGHDARKAYPAIKAVIVDEKADGSYDIRAAERIIAKSEKK